MLSHPYDASEGDFSLEFIPKSLSTTIGCKVHGSALSVKKVLTVQERACEPFSPAALTMNFSLNLVTKQVLGGVLKKL